jgi:uncharacterized protein YdiU (UPF0061 family)
MRFGRLRPFVTAAALALLVPAAASAQQPNRSQRVPLTQQERQELERRVRQQFDQRMRDEMGLSSAEQQRFMALVEDFRDQRLELSLEMRQLQVRLRREGRREDLTDEEAQALLDQAAGLRDREARLFREEQEALLTILGPAQLVKLYQWREAVTQRLRRLQGADPGRNDGQGHPDPLGWP